MRLKRDYIYLAILAIIFLTVGLLEEPEAHPCGDYSEQLDRIERQQWKQQWDLKKDRLRRGWQ